VCPRLILGKAWWDRERRAAFARTGGRCEACGVHRSDLKVRPWILEGHEVYRVDFVRGRATYVETVGLCHRCHSFIHRGRLRILYESGKVTRTEFLLTVKHGLEVLVRSGLGKPADEDDSIVPWSDWRLILFKKSYPPRFGSRAEYDRHFSSEDE
jgi:hypothetical protein